MCLVLNLWYYPSGSTFKNKHAFGFHFKWLSSLCRLESVLLNAVQAAGSRKGSMCGSCERDVMIQCLPFAESLTNPSSYTRILWMRTRRITDSRRQKVKSHRALLLAMPRASWLLSQCLQACPHVIHWDLLEVNAPPLSLDASREYCLYKETGRHMLISLDHCGVYINVKIAKMECKTKMELYVQQIKVKFADLISSRN